MKIEINTDDSIAEDEVVSLYQSNNWSSAHHPERLIPALRNSHTLVTARIQGRLVGIANAISDGYLVVYYPHLLVHSEFHGIGIGRKIMDTMQSIYSEFHQQMLVADSEAIDFYKAIGFKKAGTTESMWIYSGDDH